jgi:hypothetical protein
LEVAQRSRGGSRERCLLVPLHGNWCAHQVMPTKACAVQNQIRRRERRAEPAGTRTRATARGWGISNSAIKTATALTIQRFMSSHLRLGPSRRSTLAWNVAEYRGATATRIEIRPLNKKAPAFLKLLSVRKNWPRRSRATTAPLMRSLMPRALIEVAPDEIAERSGECLHKQCMRPAQARLRAPTQRGKRRATNYS